MRQDKLTTKLQEALADAQSLAVGNDNQYIEPVHLLAALLGQDDGGARSLLQRACRPRCARRSTACRKCPAPGATCRWAASSYRC
jgi:ATP-dependent Clp protease ATP-binding subunit ClpA